MNPQITHLIGQTAEHLLKGAFLLTACVGIAVYLFFHLLTMFILVDQGPLGSDYSRKQRLWAAWVTIATTILAILGMIVIGKFWT